MTTLINFENELGNIRTALVNEEAYFVGKDVAEALGYKDISDALAKHVDEEDKLFIDGKTQRQNAAEFNYKELGQRGGWLINESGLYALIFGSQLPQAKEFKRWVTKEVLPTIRQRGCFVTEAADEEVISNELKYGKYRIKRHFSNILYKDLEEEYNNAIAYITKEYPASERIGLYVSLIKGLDELHNALTAEPTNIGKCYEIRQLQKQLVEIKNKLQNRINGGIKSHQTKTIKQLQAYKHRTPDLSQFHKINVHPFSVNYMYEYVNGKQVRSKAYNAWINNFPTHQLPDELDFYTDRPVRLYIYYTCKADMDVKNFDKSFIDLLQNLYGFDDNIIDECICKRYETCRDYKEGEIYFFIENIAEEEDNLYA